MREAFTMEEHLRELTAIRALVRAASDVDLRPVSEWEVAIVLGSGETIHLELEPRPPHGIAGIRVEGG